jgi:ATP-binding protein involved in chromosome partitioning
VPLVGSVPLDAGLVAGGDEGEPVALEEAGKLSEIFAALAARIATEISPLVEMGGCSARLLEQVERALGPVED